MIRRANKGPEGRFCSLHLEILEKRDLLDASGVEAFPAGDDALQDRNFVYEFLCPSGLLLVSNDSTSGLDDGSALDIVAACESTLALSCGSDVFFIEEDVATVENDTIVDDQMCEAILEANFDEASTDASDDAPLLSDSENEVAIIDLVFNDYEEVDSSPEELISESYGLRSGNEDHADCNNSPQLCGAFGIGDYDASSGGGASGGSAPYAITLKTNALFHCSFTATDPDELLYSVDEALTYSLSGDLPTYQNVSWGKASGEQQYTLSFDLSFSTPGVYSVSLTVSDRHGLTSNVKTAKFKVVEIQNFAILERAPGENSYHALQDLHVVWEENDNILDFITTPILTDPDEQASFRSLFTYTIHAREYFYNELSNHYYQPDFAPWLCFDNTLPSLGVYDLEIEISPNNSYTSIFIAHSLYYCFNRISVLQWTTPNDYSIGNDGALVTELDAQNCKVYAEQQYYYNGVDWVLSAPKHRVDVRVQLGVHVPQNLTATVKINIFDPDNPHGSYVVPASNSYGIRDNYGSFHYVTGNVLSFTSVTSAESILKHSVIVFDNPHAGDDYIVAAHPNASAVDNAVLLNADFYLQGVMDPVEFLKSSKKLTIWRTLWAEIDVARDDDGTDSIYAPKPVITGYVANELTKACITIRETENNTTTSHVFASAAPLSTPQVLSLNYTHFYNEVANCSSSFWSIYIVGAFDCLERPTLLGYTFYTGYNEGDVVVFDENLVDVYISHLAVLNNEPVDTYPRDLDPTVPISPLNLSLQDIKNLTLLHEIIHSLGKHFHYNNPANGYTGTNKLMLSGLPAPSDLATLSMNDFSLIDEVIRVVQFNAKYSYQESFMGPTFYL